MTDSDIATDARILQEIGTGLQTTNANQENSNNQNRNNDRRTQQEAQVQNQIIIQNPTGLVHLGPVYNMNIGQAFTQVNKASSTNGPPPPPSTQEKEENDDQPRIQPPSKDFMRPLWYSSRVIEDDELLRLSKNIGSNWKAVGNGLKFNWAQLDQFETDTRSHNEAVHRMLFRWLQWKDQKATVGRLTKVLFNHQEYEALHCLTP